ncbi:hypothetical protein XarbCFBP7697_00350 [Xanthomonas arboricola]|nr:hypothetical protein XarbCFBP7697_00350 [Xanthomonas arboricola]
MYQYQRLMRRRGSNTYSDDERRQLLELLETAAGVAGVTLIERHPRGGYRVKFELSRDSIDAFVSILDEHDWMSVM